MTSQFMDPDLIIVWKIWKQYFRGVKDKNLALNWEKCHFMVTKGIVLGHKISIAGLEVDQETVATIKPLFPPTTVKEIRSFLGHAGFYR